MDPPAYQEIDVVLKTLILATATVEGSRRVALAIVAKRLFSKHTRK